VYAEKCHRVYDDMLAMEFHASCARATDIIVTVLKILRVGNRSKRGIANMDLFNVK
jgi:hypothetical protein